MAEHHLAQLNVGRLLGPTDSSVVAEFMANLEPINALAEAAPGFVWRLQTDAGNATDIKVLDDELFVINLSVWESVEHFHDYTYRSDHRLFLGRRKEWFEPATEATLVMWWIPAGGLPTIDEAMDRLATLRHEGPTAEAFTYKSPFPPPA